MENLAFKFKNFDITDYLHSQIMLMPIEGDESR